MKIFFIICDGGGFADHLEIAHGTTVAELFAQQVHCGDPSGYLIRVNRQYAPRDQTLQEGAASASPPKKSTGRKSIRSFFLVGRSGTAPLRPVSFFYQREDPLRIEPM